MIIPTLEGWTVGENVTAAKLTKHTKTAIENGIYYKPFCEIQSNGGSLSIPAATFTKFAMPTVVEDTDGMADVANSQIKIKTAGRYRVSGQGSFGNSSGTISVLIGVNGGHKASSTDSGISTAYNTRICVSRTIRLAVNDVLTLQAYCSGIGNVESAPTYGGCWMSAEWVSM